MANFNSAAASYKSFQAGTGQAPNGTWEALDGVANYPVAKGVLIRNINGAAVALLISSTSGVLASGSAYSLSQGQEVYIPIKEIDQIRVTGSGATVDYTWIAC